ncbi:MobF family relaxase [Flavobacterium sp.]|uniref:MobF family relaxase n=1 Tax=Flavobacterium sp. TaxID=239 RepID=UPI0039E4F39C
MIRMIQSQSAGHAKSYFKDALAKSDYYVSDQELPGFWQGRLADRLGLDTFEMKDAFFALCENQHPGTGDNLTPRTKENRKIGYDINFHCPKSVSILHAFSQDDHILKAFQYSVTEAMQSIQDDAKTLVRMKGQQGTRDTSELAWAHFTHQTARPIEGQVPDPHLHSHCFVFNATWDATEERIKAGEFRDIKRDMPYYQAMFHKSLSDRLSDLGYNIRKTDKSFEIDGVPQKVIDLFCKRTDEIGRIAKEKGISTAKELDQLGARSRASKQKGRDMAELRGEWRQQIERLGEDGKSGGVVRFAPSPAAIPVLTATLCLEHAKRHHFERASVVPERKMLETACRHSIGTKIGSGEIRAAFDADNKLIHVMEGSRRMCTEIGVLGEEKRMVELAKQGQGKLIPLYDTAPELTLFGQQAAAVEHILTTANRVSIIRGAAGTGKTTILREAMEKFEAKGKEVTVVAPTAQASRGVLREDEGIAGADTVARLLMDKEMQARLKGQVLWVDEAGLLGTKDMTSLLEIATEQNAQLILGGDTRQHASVVRGDALRILNKFANVRVAEVTKIYRQESREYKSAVKDLSDGKVANGFSKLDKLGFIKAIERDSADDALVDGYMDALKSGKSALVVCPTHAQGSEITGRIRARMREDGMLGRKEIDVLRLKNLNLTEAERADTRNYEDGQIVKFQQNVPGFARGSLWTVEKNGNEVLLVNSDGERKPVPTKRSKDFQLYALEKISLSKGDRVVITEGSTDRNGKKLENSTILTVTRVLKNGEIELQHEKSKNTYHIDKGFGCINYGQCVTSHASQGKTVDEVFIYQPSTTFNASNAKQFYVSISRGKQKAHLFTDNKGELLEQVKEPGDRQSALELMDGRHRDRNLSLEFKQQQTITIQKNRNHEPDR